VKLNNDEVGRGRRVRGKTGNFDLPAGRDPAGQGGKPVELVRYV